MTQGAVHIDLLEAIQQKVHAMYLSDLCTELFCNNAIKLALTIEDERYPVREWNEAFSYILRSKIVASTPAEAKTAAMKIIDSK